MEPEVEQIFQHIERGENFLLSGGAGSGKTFSLVNVIRRVIQENPTAKIACMTFTNAAVKEIEHRVNHSNLSVSTIHDFLWNNIKSFQKELKRSLIDLINDISVEQIPTFDAPVQVDFFDNLQEGVQYKEWLRLSEGIISHDELIVLAEHMYATYPKLSDILKDKFKFIFIDEYQDTHKKVVEIFLVHLNRSKRRNIIGFFGDAMQAIYEDGIGDLNEYRTPENLLVHEVKKEENRRNPLSVIDLANNLRTDGLRQKPSKDENAPNMINGAVKQGSIKFLHSTTKNLDYIKATEHFADWDFKNSKKTKELNLTHNLIAPKVGFQALMEIYDRDPILKFKSEIKKAIKDQRLDIDASKSFDEVVLQVNLRSRGVSKRDTLLQDPINIALYNQLKDLPFAEVSVMYQTKDALIDDKKQDEQDTNKKGSKRDYLIRHLFKIQFLVHLYKNKDYNEFLRRTELRVTSIKDKKAIKEIIHEMDAMGDSTIQKVIDFANQKGLVRIDERLTKFMNEKAYLYGRVKEIKFSAFQNLFYYLEGFTPFSTQHKIKGAEFDDVLVILDNGKWYSDYNFRNLFVGGGSEYVLAQTQKIFYVCCTRSKENLIVYMDNPEQGIIGKAEQWFGKANVHKIE